MEGVDQRAEGVGEVQGVGAVRGVGAGCGGGGGRVDVPTGEGRDREGEDGVLGAGGYVEGEGFGGERG